MAALLVTFLGTRDNPARAVPSHESGETLVEMNVGGEEWEAVYRVLPWDEAAIKTALRDLAIEHYPEFAGDVGL